MIFTGDFRNHNMVTWIVNEKCNFHCDYCVQWQNFGQKLEPISINKLSESLNALQKEWVIHITGGEPFLEKNIIDICNEVTKKHYLALNTNLSLPRVFDFADNIDPARTLFVSAGAHIAEREKRDPKLSAFIEKILYLQKKRFNIIVNYVTHPINFNRIKSDIAYLESKGVQKARIKMFRGIHKGKYYPYSFTSDDIKFMESMEAEYPEFEILRKSHKFYRQLCRAGQIFFIMDRDGNLKRCSSLYRNYGNFLEKSIKYDPKPRPCPLKRCTCPYEGIRNVISAKGSVTSVIGENIFENTLRLERLLKNPKLLKKIKIKAADYFK